MLLHRALSRLGNVNVVFVEEALRDEISCADESGLAATVRWRRDWTGLRRYKPIPGLTAPLERALGRALADYDIVVGRYLGSISKIDLPRHVPAIVDLDDINPRLWNGTFSPAALKAAAKSLLMRVCSAPEFARYHSFFFVTRRDRERLARLQGEVLPNIPFSGDASPDFRTGERQILFVGSMWYRPNAEGLDWFLAAVWPRILAKLPDADLVVVGAAAPEVRARWGAHPGAQAVGFVDDLGTLYRRAALVISPIRTGGGSNIKVLEAMAWGKAVVMTRFSFDGFADTMQDGRDVCVANDATEFAHACVGLLTDVADRAKIAEAGHSVVRNSYSKARFEQVVARTVRALLD